MINFKFLELLLAKMNKANNKRNFDQIDENELSRKRKSIKRDKKGKSEFWDFITLYKI